MRDKKEIINKLRNDRINCDAFNKETLNSACEKLADELYNTKTHFFYEIIQNAEDNRYNRSVIPSIDFLITSDKILIQNNEIGFTKEDIQSLSDIGKSHKEKSEERHDIGEKGIGFKSVFGITDTPMIFSNGFHFRFNANEKLGYISPEWIENIPSEVIPGITNLIFPLNSSGKKVLHSLKEIDPEIILFLKKLRKLKFSNEISGDSFNIDKTNKEKKILLNIKRYKKEEFLQYYHIIKQFNRPLELIEKYRDKIQTTEIEFAFPLENEELIHNYDGRVFSFLPISSYDGKVAFPFILQADFLLTSNRSEIREDNEWNVWLRERIVDLFMITVEEFKKNKNLKFEILNILPKIEEIPNSFFGSLGKIIDGRLKNFPCFLDVDEEWILPHQVMIPTDQEILKFVPNKILKKEYSSSFINPEFYKHILHKFDVQRRLEIRSFELSDFLKILEKNDWYENNDTSWFISLYQYFGRKLKEGALYPANIDKLKIFRLEKGELVKNDEHYIYLRPDKEVNIQFDEDIRYLDKRLYKDYNKDNENDLLVIFFNKMEIGPISPQIIIEQVLLPLMQSNERNSLEFAYSFSICKYILQNLNILDEKLVSDIKKAIKFRTLSKKDEFAYRRPQDLYLTCKYRIKDDLESILTALDDREAIFVSESYIKGLKEKEIESWKEFFYKMGVNENYIPLEERKNDMFDYYFPIPLNLEEEPIKVLQFLAEHWGYLKDFQYQYEFYYWRSRRKNVHSGKKVTDVYSSWFNEIISEKWLPTTLNQKLTPSEVYLETNELKKFTLGEMPLLSLNSCNYDFKLKPDFLDSLGIKYKLTIQIVLDFIKNLKNTDNKNEQLYFEAYYFLNNNYDNTTKKIIIDFFQKDAYIFLPRSKDTSHPYFNLKELVWDKKYKKRIFSMFWGIVEPFYPNLKDFFLNILEIPEQLDLRELCNKLSILSEVNNEMNELQINFIHYVYKQIDKEIRNDTDGLLNRQWFQDFSKQGILYTNQGFWMNDNDVFYCDDNILYNVFKDEPKVAFLNIKREDYSMMKNFIDRFNIKSISTAITKSMSSDISQGFLSDLTNLIRATIPFIIRFIFNKDLNLYTELKNLKILTNILNLTCYQQINVEMNISLNHVGPDSIKLEKTINANNMIVDDKFILDEMNIRKFDLISVGISNQYFKSMMGLDDFISNMLSKLFNGSDLREINEFLELKKISLISIDEKSYLEHFFQSDELSILFNEEPELDEDEYENQEFSFIIPDSIAIQSNEGFNKLNNGSNKNPNSIERFHGASHISDDNVFNSVNRSYGGLLVPKSGNNDFYDRYWSPQSQYFNGKNKHKKNRRRNKNHYVNGSLPEIDNINCSLEYFQPNSINSIDLNLSEEENLDISEDEDFIEDMNEIYISKDEDFIESSKEEINYPKFKYEPNQNIQQALNNIQIERTKSIVGIRGEEIVFRKLKEKLKSENPNYHVVTDNSNYYSLESPDHKKIILKWLNSSNQHFKKSYDLALFQNNTKFYIEVKSTKSSKRSFSISGAEWNLAKLKGERYIIFRVSAVRSNNPRILIIQNPYKKWIDGEISANPIKIDY